MPIPAIQPISIETINKVRVIENNELLVEIVERGNIVLLSDNRYLLPYLRKQVVDMLFIAADYLPPEYKLLVVTAYRPRSMQKKMWYRRLLQLAMRYPFKVLFQPFAFRTMASKYTAPPGGSSHQCGAAVDVKLIDLQGNLIDMGTSQEEFGEVCHTAYSYITDEQKKNREILYEAMTSAGFANYPREWWHYSYGDKVWAGYNNKTECFYGPIEDK